MEHLFEGRCVCGSKPMADRKDEFCWESESERAPIAPSDGCPYLSYNSLVPSPKPAFATLWTLVIALECSRGSVLSAMCTFVYLWLDPKAGGTFTSRCLAKLGTLAHSKRSSFAHEVHHEPKFKRIRHSCQPFLLPPHIDLSVDRY